VDVNVFQGMPEGVTVYGVDLDLHLTTAHSALFMFLFMTRTFFDEAGYIRSRVSPKQVRVCAVTTNLHVPGTMSSYPGLFDMFKEAKLSFDLVECMGTILVHADVKGQCVAMGAVSTTAAKAITQLTSAVQLFDRNTDGDVFTVLSMLRLAGGKAGAKPARSPTRGSTRGALL
jgi:hypothetical protein